MFTPLALLVSLAFSGSPMAIEAPGPSPTPLRLPSSRPVLNPAAQTIQMQRPLPVLSTPAPAVAARANCMLTLDELGPTPVISFQMESSGAAMSHAGASSGRETSQGRDTMRSISLVKVVDKSSPQIFRAVAAGKPFKVAKLVCTKRSGEGSSTPEMTLTMEDVFVSSVTSHGTESVPEETITLRYVKIQRS